MFVCSISTDVLLPCNFFFFDEVLVNYSCHCIFRPSAEQALAVLQGTLIGGQNVRLSWGRSLSNKQVQIKRNIVIFLSIKLHNGAKLITLWYLNVFSLSMTRISGVLVLVLVVTMVAMDKVMRLMVGMHNLRILTCMVMEPMLVIPITNSNK